MSNLTSKQMPPEWLHTEYAQLAGQLRDIAAIPSNTPDDARTLARAADAMEDLFLGVYGSDGKRYALAEPSPPG